MLDMPLLLLVLVPVHTMLTQESRQGECALLPAQVWSVCPSR